MTEVSLSGISSSVSGAGALIDVTLMNPEVRWAVGYTTQGLIEEYFSYPADVSLQDQADNNPAILSFVETVADLDWQASWVTAGEVQPRPTLPVFPDPTLGVPVQQTGYPEGARAELSGPLPTQTYIIKADGLLDVQIDEPGTWTLIVDAAWPYIDLEQKWVL